VLHCGRDLGIAGTIKLAERLPGRRIHGNHAAGSDLGLSSHLQVRMKKSE
jgi:hypothetical protein